ncbi:MAG: hypothetical protein CSA62_00730 [Planctomycetota bacterium]|nr:MAG: hypothetical protein CSA62_00730 [Planctomycetota bacterium]
MAYTAASLLCRALRAGALGLLAFVLAGEGLAQLPNPGVAAQNKAQKKVQKESPKPASQQGGQKGEEKKPKKQKKPKKDEIEGVQTRELGDKKGGEIPRGSDPADIRAMRGAQAMAAVERKLDQVLKRMKVGAKAKFLPFDELDDWPYEDGFLGMPKRLKVWDKKRVAMAGFMLPIDTVENIKEFYLVKSLWACCYGVPPDVNGLVKVRLKTKKGIDYHYDPVLIVGSFKLEKEMDEDYCVAIYQLDAELARAIDVDSLRQESPDKKKPLPKPVTTPQEPGKR